MISGKIAVAAALTLLVAATMARAEPAAVSAGLQAASMALRMIADSAEEDVSVELIRQNYDISVALHRRFDEFADGLVTILMQVNRLSDEMRKEIEEGLDKHQRDTVRGHIQVVKERLTGIVQKLEAGEEPNNEDWRGLVRAQHRLQEESRTLAQKDDRNLAVLLEALSWEWTVHKARRNENALQEMKAFYRMRLQRMLDPDRSQSIAARRVRGAKVIDREIESIEKVVSARDKIFNAPRPPSPDSSNEDLPYCAFRLVPVFEKDGRPKIEGEKLGKKLTGPLKVQMEGRLSLCRLHIEMMEAVGKTLGNLGAHTGDDSTAVESDSQTCGSEWRATRKARWAKLQVTADTWQKIDRVWTLKWLPRADPARCGPDGNEIGGKAWRGLR